MAQSDVGKTADIRIATRLSAAFRRFQDRVRERAYQLSLLRDPAQGNPMTDWLEAEAELSELVQLEVKEQKKNTVVELQLKEFNPRDIEIEVAGNVLQIFGTHHETSRDKKAGCASRTRAFFQSVLLSDPVDVDRSQAKMFKNGKLKIVLPKTR